MEAGTLQERLTIGDAKSKKFMDPDSEQTREIAQEITLYQ